MSGEGSRGAGFGGDRPADAEAGRVPISHRHDADRRDGQRDRQIRHRNADANAATLQSGARVGIVPVLPSMTGLMPAGMPVHVAMLRRTGFGGGGRRGNPDRAAGHEGKRGEQDNQPAQEGSHAENASLLLPGGQVHQNRD